MPTFPTYNGELPACLSPTNPRHYLLLIYWIYFRPTAFDGDAYFTGVWRQTQSSAPTILKALASSEKPMTADIISQEARLPYHEAQTALKALASHDIVKETHSGWQLTVELMRRWVRRER